MPPVGDDPVARGARRRRPAPSIQHRGGRAQPPTQTQVAAGRPQRRPGGPSRVAPQTDAAIAAAPDPNSPKWNRRRITFGSHEQVALSTSCARVNGSKGGTRPPSNRWSFNAACWRIDPRSSPALARRRRPHHRIRRRGGRTSPQPKLRNWRRRPAGGASESVRLRVARLTNVAGKISQKNCRKRNWRSAAQPARAGRSAGGARRSAPPRARTREIRANKVNAALHHNKMT